MGCDDGGRHVGGWVDGGKAAAERKVRGESVKITVFSAPNLETLDFILRCVLISCPQHSLYSKAFLGLIIKQALSFQAFRPFFLHNCIAGTTLSDP